jgi:hypothetical protein
LVGSFAVESKSGDKVHETEVQRVLEEICNEMDRHFLRLAPSRVVLIPIDVLHVGLELRRRRFDG